MHTLAAFYSALSGTLTYQSLAGVLDQSLTLSANARFIFPAQQKVLGGLVLGTGLTAARHDAPSMRNLVLPEIYPTIVGAVVPDNPNYLDYMGTGPGVLTNEEYAIDASHTGAGPDDVFAGVWITPQFVPAPAGPSYTLVATATPTLVKGAWVNIAMTFNQTLPAGEYTVIGLQVICTSGLFARLVFPGQNQFRPGCIVNPTYGQSQRTLPFRNGNAGLMGRFQNTAQPSIELLGVAAGAQTATIMIDVIKTR